MTRQDTTGINFSQPLTDLLILFGFWRRYEETFDCSSRAPAVCSLNQERGQQHAIARTNVSPKILLAELIRLPTDLSTPSATYSYCKSQHLCTNTFPPFCRQRQTQQGETLCNDGGLEENENALSILAQRSGHTSETSPRDKSQAAERL